MHALFAERALEIAQRVPHHQVSLEQRPWAAGTPTLDGDHLRYSRTMRGRRQPSVTADVINIATGAKRTIVKANGGDTADEVTHEQTSA